MRTLTALCVVVALSGGCASWQSFHYGDCVRMDSEFYGSGYGRVTEKRGDVTYIAEIHFERGVTGEFVSNDFKLADDKFCDGK